MATLELYTAACIQAASLSERIAHASTHVAAQCQELEALLYEQAQYEIVAANALRRAQESGVTEFVVVECADADALRALPSRVVEYPTDTSDLVCSHGMVVGMVRPLPPAAAVAACGGALSLADAEAVYSALRAVAHDFPVRVSALTSPVYDKSADERVYICVSPRSTTLLATCVSLPPA